VEVEVRPVRPEDCARISEFRSRMEGGRYLAAIRGEAFYARKYLHWGRALVLEEGGRIAGTIAAIPKRVRLGNEVVPAADLGDLFVDPGLRGRGLFRRLYDDLVRRLEADGVRMLTVRPGRRAEPLLRRAFGFQPLFGVREWVAALDEEGIRALPLGRLPLVRAVLPRARWDVPAPPDMACRSASPLGLAPPEPFGDAWPAAGTVRDAAWLADRYALDPTPYETTVVERRGRVAGVVVYLVLPDPGGRPSRGWIVDAWTGREYADAALPLAAFALADIRRKGASLVHFWSARGPRRGVDPMVEALRSLGLRGISRGREVLYRFLGGGPPPTVSTGRDWMFRMGDTDGI
jgi:GNAT superfamily N-acetyltransferase